MTNVVALLYRSTTSYSASPRVGKWLVRDPIGYEGGINLYGYVQNSSISWIDPFGLNGYIFFNMSPGAGPGFAPEAGHVWVGVDNPNGGVTTREAAWDTIGRTRNWDNLQQAAQGSTLTVILPNHSLNNSNCQNGNNSSPQTSDAAILDFLNSGNKPWPYVYCSNYAAEAVAQGGWNGNGFSPNALLNSMRNIIKLGGSAVPVITNTRSR